MSAADSVTGVSRVGGDKSSVKWRELTAAQFAVNRAKPPFVPLGQAGPSGAGAQPAASEQPASQAPSAPIKAASDAVGTPHLTAVQQAEVERLKAEDRSVRALEASHLAAAGPSASGIDYTFALGPDGQLYAVSGKINFVIQSSSNPEEALSQARQILSAASTPDDPSGTDMTVVARARQMEAEAQAQLAEIKAKAEAAAVPAATSQTAQIINKTA